MNELFHEGFLILRENQAHNRCLEDMKKLTFYALEDVMYLSTARISLYLFHLFKIPSLKIEDFIMNHKGDPAVQCEYIFETAFRLNF